MVVEENAADEDVDCIATNQLQFRQLDKHRDTYRYRGRGRRTRTMRSAQPAAGSGTLHDIISILTSVTWPVWVGDSGQSYQASRLLLKNISQHHIIHIAENKRQRI
jgi:hypothetical protein